MAKHIFFFLMVLCAFTTPSLAQIFGHARGGIFGSVVTKNAKIPNLNESFIGMTIIFNSNVDPRILSDYLYDGNAYSSRKFKKEYLYSRNIIGKRLKITEMFFDNKGKEYKEAYCIVFTVENENLILRLPLSLQGFSNPIFLTNGKTRRLSKGLGTVFDAKDINFGNAYYDATLIDELKSKIGGTIAAKNEFSWLKQNAILVDVFFDDEIQLHYKVKTDDVEHDYSIDDNEYLKILNSHIDYSAISIPNY